MSQDEAKKIIQSTPVGTKLQLIKKNGDIIEVRLASQDVNGREAKDYESLVVPALPPAIIVQGTTRFGNFRIDTEEIVKIARIG